MTPKEKAEKLVLMFELCQSKELRGYNHDTAVDSAILCCKVVLQPFLIDYSMIEHWKEVEKELKLLKN